MKIRFLNMSALPLRRRDAPWEVVDHKVVQPVPMFYEDEDIDILRLSDYETRGTYVFDLEHPHDRDSARDWRKALIFARQQLLKEIAKRGYNVMLLEGWSLTVLRKSHRYRIEVQYEGRGALVSESGKLTARFPPFMELVDAAA